MLGLVVSLFLVRYPNKSYFRLVFVTSHIIANICRLTTCGAMYSDAVWILIVLSNLAYLVPAIVAHWLRFYNLTAALVLVTLFSSVHHICDDAKMCGLHPSEVLTDMDLICAYLAIAITLLNIATYDLVPNKPPKKGQSNISSTHILSAAAAAASSRAARKASDRWP